MPWLSAQKTSRRSAAPPPTSEVLLFKLPDTVNQEDLDTHVPSDSPHSASSHVADLRRAFLMSQKSLKAVVMHLKAGSREAWE